VDTLAPNFAFPRRLSSHFATVRFFYRSLVLLFFAGLIGGMPTGAEVPTAHGASFGPSPSFSISDFDGDLKPDLASVQAGRSDFSRTDYLIQLQLSAAGQQTFQIVAPMGGLQIALRDVNGDHALDLILTTTWLRQPVAVLLNDGHGSFTRVDPAAFPEAFRESKTSWGPTTHHATDAVGIPPQSREDICSKTELFLHLRSQSGSIAFSDSRLALATFLISHLGRAPPFELPHPVNTRLIDK
jgi:hypothetical protein